MDLQVIIEQILPDETWVSKQDGSTKVRHSFIGKTLGQYPKKMKFDVMNQDAWGKMGLRVGVIYNVGFDAESREFNGRWYTSLNAWKAFVVDNVGNNTVQQVQNPVPQHQAQPQQVVYANLPVSNYSSDLPF